ncbi:monovalent cation/H(+) antiporter subunit G [Bartonella ancashensis]|uniref:Na(+) H(+) antiporter subunit G n=1 Tax=Bartonella ancashensis TaxID=1318743 RepID=A0A0M5KUD9_9HYPH|nr:monovalent cation/H(+) antiporter subunit G [Bartonella ancashensis]ALE03236.1 Na(+) H(+) antiporter subunit G [Bartonella ancashensis]
MNDDVPLLFAIIIAIFLIIGSGLTLIGTIGLIRFSTFYDRLHTPSLGASWGAISIATASLFYSIFVDHQLIFHEVLLVVFLLMTIPITSMLLSQAAAYRDPPKGWQEKPPTFLIHQQEQERTKLKTKKLD